MCLLWLSRVYACSISHVQLSAKPMDCSPPDSSVHGILPGGILESDVISSSRGSSQPRDRTQVSCIGRQTLYHLNHQGSPICHHYLILNSIVSFLFAASLTTPLMISCKFQFWLISPFTGVRLQMFIYFQEDLWVIYFPSLCTFKKKNKKTFSASFYMGDVSWSVCFMTISTREERGV